MAFYDGHGWASKLDVISWAAGCEIDNTHPSGENVCMLSSILSQPSLLLIIAQDKSNGTAVAGKEATGVAWSKVLDAHFENGELVVALGPIALMLFGLAIVAAIVWRVFLRERLLPEYEVVEAELDLAKIGKVTLKPNHQNVQIAHQAWVELTTRKAALLFDEDHDVVVEVYDSYYQLFAHLRDLTKNIPAHKLRKCADTRKLVEIMIRVLNEGLRPHLTRWQARFRRWYNDALKASANSHKSPQEIQKQFPEYAALAKDLKQLQVDVVKYAQFLREIAQGKPT